MNRAALSAPSLSMAPPRCIGLFATTPTGRPSRRIRAVIIPTPKSRRSSSTESVSASVVSTDRTSYTRRRFSGTARRRRRWSAAVQSGVAPWK
jgi:hypothetical protein